MHDLSLGPPVDVGEEPDAKHSGPCYDGVYGCHKCHSAANDGKGSVGNCDSCKRLTFTQIIKAWDEPVMYEECAACVRVERAGMNLECCDDVPYYDDDEHVSTRYTREDYQRWYNEAVEERNRLKDVVDEEAKAIYDAQRKRDDEAMESW